MSDMIPIKLADQAVAACEAEIAKLREENIALKAEVERLTKQTDYERMYRETIELLKKNNL